jgi:uncharacterized protein
MAARKFTWDDAKDRANRVKHGIGFDQARRIDWDEAIFEIDDREDYGELRETAYGPIGVKLYFLVFTVRGDAQHLISLRKARKFEVRYYVDKKNRIEGNEMGQTGPEDPSGGRGHDRRRRRRHHRGSK